MSKKYIRIFHTKSKTLIAEGPVGWYITPFEGNYYIHRDYLQTNGFKTNYLPGFCIYKFLYVWLDYVDAKGEVSKSLAWRYWLPNPLLPFIWNRVAISKHHSEILVEEFDKA
ncbi:hypothetical protein FM038_013455 [Shewanella eurypsychrophilus]|uniref:Uncharacterized protein n=1 Tax=Shewanella eurypsychrophilus TaxID=2593656 RepID=A0ABX6V7G5_9GAMM|nr:MULTISPECIES: hypothetical protein [Shewanella]QFU23056.1 hypothetical protein FS418_15035 [Shewanella sp. YLB-09]QPG58339.1 hypothetical protein FM038_013455 [Shewanella eurypsychrophilus]